MHRFALFSSTSPPVVFLRWLILIGLLGAAAGTVVAFFLWSLDAVTHVRWANPWLLWLLPLSGIPIVVLYHRFGKSSERGNKLIIEQIHEPGGGVPRRMAPLVLFTSLVTHLFGGSAGREGTAVQIGGSIGQTIAGHLHLSWEETRALLLAGMAAGFGAVFGTPLTGALFAMELVGFRRARWFWILPCLAASELASACCTAWKIHHTHYTITADMIIPSLSQLPMFLLMSLAFGLAAALFVHLSHQLQKFFKSAIAIYWLRPVIGGIAVIALTYLLQTRDYLGLGVTTPDGKGVSIVNAFHAGGAQPLSWLWKILFTAVTLSAGFKGGEVTPLFFIGATLGNVLAGPLGIPVDLAAGLGFVAVFAGATRTPLACTLMGMELFGARYGLLFALACGMACWVPAKENG